MAKFCVYCGRSLEEGEECHCRDISSRAVPSKTEEKVAQAVVSASKAGGYLQGLWSLIKRSFRAPSQMMRSFAASADSNAALGLIGIQAIVFGLFMDAFCSQITAALADALQRISFAVGSIFGRSSGNSFGNSDDIANLVKFPMGKIFFLSLILAVAAALLFAGILLVFSKIFKGQATYRHMLCVSGANSLAAAPLLLLGIVGLWINFKLGIGLACLSLLLQPYFTFEALNGTAAVEEDKSVYVCFLSFAVLTLVMLFVVKQVYPQYLPTGLTSLLNEAKSYTNNASSLLNGLVGGSYSN